MFSANVADKEFIIKGDNGTSNEQNKQFTNKDIIKNPQVDVDKDLQNKFETKKNILVSGSNYQNIVPNVGVRIQEEDKSKTGGLDFKNQFGRMSMKEYEMLRNKYAQTNESNAQKNNYNYNNYDNVYNNQNNNNEKDIWKRSESYDYNKNYQINRSNQGEEDSNNQISSNYNYYQYSTNHMHNIGLKHYDWGSDEKIIMPDINNNINIRSFNQNIINNDNNGHKVLNENLFKRSVTKKHSIYGMKYSDKNLNYKINKEKAGKDINVFNNQIMQNKNWGSVNNSYKVGRTNFSNSIKKVDGMNMRTRKKY